MLTRYSRCRRYGSRLSLTRMRVCRWLLIYRCMLYKARTDYREYNNIFHIPKSDPYSDFSKRINT